MSGAEVTLGAIRLLLKFCEDVKNTSISLAIFFLFRYNDK